MDSGVDDMLIASHLATSSEGIRDLDIKGTLLHPHAPMRSFQHTLSI